MKQVKIYTRTILERTGFKKYPYKEVEQISIIFNGKEIKNHFEKIDNEKLKKPFKLILKTTSEKKLNQFIETLSRTDDDKWLKECLTTVLNKEGK